MNQTLIPADKARQCADAVRFLSADAVERANSGHPGLPMGPADLAVALWGTCVAANKPPVEHETPPGTCPPDTPP